MMCAGGALPGWARNGLRWVGVPVHSGLPNIREYLGLGRLCLVGSYISKQKFYLFDGSPHDNGGSRSCYGRIRRNVGKEA